MAIARATNDNRPTTAITIENHLGSGWLHLGDGWHVQKRFTATVAVEPRTGRRLQLEIEVDRAGNPHCRSLTFQSDPNAATFEDSITTEVLRRLPITTLVSDCFRAALRPLTQVGVDESGPIFEARQKSETALEAVFPKGAARVKQRKPISDEELKLIARAYRVAIEGDLPPTKLLADKFNVDRSTARRWVQRAVEKGFLDSELRLDPGTGARQGRRLDR